MVQELAELLPKEAGRLAMSLMGVGLLAGIGLWVAGARMSRSLVTLSLVAVGAAVGQALPRWCGWHIDGMATAAGGAVVLGTSGYILHRFWIGMGMGTVLAAWAAVVTWVLLMRGQAWTWPPQDPAQTTPALLANLWQALPANVTRTMPLACGAAFLLGMVSALFKPAAGVIWLYSIIGTSLMLGLGLTLVQCGQPQWLAMVPQKNGIQMAIALLTVAIGALVQWTIMRRGGHPTAGPKPAHQ